MYHRSGLVSFPKNPHRRTFLHLYHSFHSTHRVDGQWAIYPLVHLSHHPAYGSRTGRFVKQNVSLFTPIHLSATFKHRLYCCIPMRIFTSQYVQPFLSLWDLSIYGSSLPLSTMTSATADRSADFSICNSYNSRSPQVRAYSFTQYPLDLLYGFLVLSHPLDVSMMCYLIRLIQPLYPIPVRWNRDLQSRFLHCYLHR